MNIDESLKSIQKKLGKENSGKIADDIANIMTIDSNYKKDIKDKDDYIIKLKEDKEVLITANGRLLKQVSQEDESILNPKKEEKEEYKPFDFRSALDEKGNFKK